MEIKTNAVYENGGGVRVTITTPVYNRRKTLPRTIASIRAQTYRNFEYIIVDDGSCEAEQVDDIVQELMDTADFPVMFIKKENGGVHTARNLGVKYARGELYSNIDSDDAFTPDALQKFVDAWDSIPDDKKPQYREIVAQCMDENGNRVGEPFPDNINNVDWQTAWKMCDATGGEHIGFDVTKVRKENLFPEPEGITFITEGILWNKLSTKYKSYFINDMVRIYYHDTDNALSDRNKRKKNIQSCINARWESAYFINHWDEYSQNSTLGSKFYTKTMLRYCIMEAILKQKQVEDYKPLPLTGIGNNAVKFMMKAPAYVLANVYIKKRM